MEISESAGHDGLYEKADVVWCYEYQPGKSYGASNEKIERSLATAVHERYGLRAVAVVLWWCLTGNNGKMHGNVPP